ncbi:exodeoxyribonuclease VII large subunit [Thermincola ferriacetica]
MTVAELNNYIKEKLEGDLFLNNIWLKGEISNFKFHYSGHMYFTLKDAQATIKCVMFRSRCSNLKFLPENGMGVVARGRVGVYERDGQYQLYIEEMQPDGIGTLYIAFQQLKEKLEKEGLFNQELKKKIPRLPKRVAVVTSPTGAAVRDIITVLHRRCPHIEILLIPVAVQGENAPPEIARAIEMVNAYGQADVIIVGRGGGSLEELWAFNTEIVARSIFASSIPVVSAVGHETDFTIADFVADLRAPTPSAAAELVAPNYLELVQRFAELQERLVLGINFYLQKNRNRLEVCMKSRAMSRPMDLIQSLVQKLDYTVVRLEQAMRGFHREKGNRFRVACAGLNNLNPLATLERGYAVCRDKVTGSPKTTISQFRVGETVEIILRDGLVDCTVERTEEGNS